MSTLSMVVTLVTMVFGVFLCFASVAVYCYRYAPGAQAGPGGGRPAQT